MTYKLRSKGYKIIGYEKCSKWKAEAGVEGGGLDDFPGRGETKYKGPSGKKFCVLETVRTL